MFLPSLHCRPLGADRKNLQQSCRLVPAYSWYQPQLGLHCCPTFSVLLGSSSSHSSSGYFRASSDTHSILLPSPSPGALTTYFIKKIEAIAQLLLCFFTLSQQTYLHPTCHYSFLSSCHTGIPILPALKLILPPMPSYCSGTFFHLLFCLLSSVFPLIVFAPAA